MKLSGRIQRREAAPATLPILGKIKTGEKRVSQSGKEYPASLDHFKCTGDYAALFHKVYGDKPSRITVVFHSDDFSQVANERLELRDKAGRLVASSDGNVVRYYDAKTDEYVWTSRVNEPDIHERLERGNNGPVGWQAVLTLRVLLPKIPSVLGVWEITTKGEASSIPAVVGTLNTVQEMGGTIRGVPMDLIVEKVSSQKPGSKSNYPVLRLIPNLSQENLEDLRDLVESGVHAMRRLSVLTPEKLEAMSNPASESRQIAAPTAPSEPEVADAEVVEPAQPAQPDQPAQPTHPKHKEEPVTLSQYDRLVELYPNVPKEWAQAAKQAAKEGKLDDDRAAEALLTKFTLCIQACTMLVNANEAGWIGNDEADDLHRQITDIKVKPSELKKHIEQIKTLQPTPEEVQA